MKRHLLWAGTAAALLAVAIACGSSPTGSTSGNFKVMLKDTPFGEAKAVLVTFSEISVHASGGAWTTIPFSDNATSRTCDLKQLQTTQDILGVATLPAGHYTQVRVTVTAVTIYFDNAANAPACAATIAAPNGRSSSVNVPSGQLILPPRDFDITSGNTATMTLDFDGDKSITQTGNGTYIITPVITVSSVQ